MITNLFRKQKGPVFLKEDSGLVNNLEELKNLSHEVRNKNSLERDIYAIEQGIIGEKNVEFELRNSHLPIIVLKDVYYEFEGQKAQIDFLVFTTKLMFVIECKNLYGNIDINNEGDFVRTINNGNKTWKEGIYSPITQNQRHKELLRKISLASKSNFLTKYILDGTFDKYCIPVVVLANPKTILRMKYAPKSIKNQVIRADQLIRFIIQCHNSSKEEKMSEKRQMSWAQFYLQNQAVHENTFILKYLNETPQDIVPMEEREIYKALKKYRLVKSKETSLAAYYIYNNKQMEELIVLAPSSVDDLKSLNWMDDEKLNKYGQDIITIFLSVM